LDPQPALQPRIQIRICQAAPHQIRSLSSAYMQPHVQIHRFLGTPASNPQSSMHGIMACCVTRGYPQAVPAGENADLGHTATGQSETCKIDPHIHPAPQIQPTLCCLFYCLHDNSSPLSKILQPFGDVVCIFTTLCEEPTTFKQNSDSTICFMHLILRSEYFNS